MTDELRVIKAFLETLKIELVHKDDNWKPAIRFTNMKPGYRQGLTVEMDALPAEMRSLIDALLLKSQETANPQDERL